MHLKRKFDTGEFAILAELDPPKGVDVSTMVTNARRVKGNVDAFVVPEMSNAVMRMSSLGGAMILQKEGMETVMQLNCRDRNRIALQADLLAAYGCGITSVMAVTGEDPSYGDHHQARSVYDIDLLELLRAVKSLQEGRDMAGIELEGSPRFLVGSTVDAGAKGKSPELVLEEMNQKVDAGAEFFITPPLFDLSAIEPFVKRVDLQKIKIIPTVLLLKSLGMARYIQRNVDHVYIPDALIARIQKSPEKVRECIRIASEIAKTLQQEGFGGVLLATIGWEHKLPEIIDRM
ncbi:MAG: methylenetetrahydrofolate reductase [Desulfobacterales bacterium]|uniref:Methylenetetrahydrofolate reductase n=1 Tax=Candidatus Desulfatibia profunda TaxID=2841695 RepID=A0A8J6NKD9_9BACT|nr:methylenetetrahydrofolate reductase [Candidatus Desulfatibia profunda]MBL7178988.1 methylenetetrahydrofolate reductase [Desulfobacterales bacterium]